MTDASGTHYAQLDATLQTGPGGTFAFENSHVGTGTSYGNAMTELSISVTNDSRTRQDLRLDSEVTPGHIAARDAGAAAPMLSGSFVFQVFRLGVVLPFYHVDATINPHGLGFGSNLNGPDEANNFLTLNGLKRTRTANSLAYDWGATNISINLGVFAPGETQTFIYSLATRTNLFAPTSERAGALANVCDGVQVSFGDPRTMGGSGGGSIAVAARAARPASQAPSSAACDVNRIDPFIGLPFGAFNVPISVVPASDPLPAQPPAPTPVNYNAVPEPAAFGLLALGLAGLTARRRQRA